MSSSTSTGTSTSIRTGSASPGTGSVPVARDEVETPSCVNVNGNDTNGNDTNGNGNGNAVTDEIHPLPHLDSETYNPMPHKLSEGDNATPLEVIGSAATDKLAIIMVGLPATGKTHIAKRICRFLSFFHDIPSQIFNVGDYRRQLCGAQLPADFYDPANQLASKARHMACDAAIADMTEYLQQDGVRVAALDATNSTKERRNHILTSLTKAGIGCKKMFVESICDSQELLEENIRKVKLSTPDYRDMDPEEAIRDFHERRRNYMSVYEPVDETDGPHLKIINSRQFVVTNIRGYLPLKVVHFVMNLHTLPRTFYLTRHGQSEYNVLGKIGGDSGLSQNGVKYAKRLAQFAKDCIAKGGDIAEGDAYASTDDAPGTSQRPCRLWTSTMRRTKETAQFISHSMLHCTFDNGDSLDWVQFRPMARRNLDELYAGVCDGMTYKEIEALFPEEFQRRQDDKLAYRYPRGESRFCIMRVCVCGVVCVCFLFACFNIITANFNACTMRRLSY